MPRLFNQCANLFHCTVFTHGGHRRFGGTTFFKFTPLTLVPIETKMVDTELMTPQEVAWLDGYHAKVWEAVSPRLSDKPEALDWLKRSTRPLHEQLA